MAIRTLPIPNLIADPNHTPILYPVHNLNLILNPTPNRKPNPLPNLGNLTLYVTLYLLLTRSCNLLFQKCLIFENSQKNLGNLHVLELSKLKYRVQKFANNV